MRHARHRHARGSMPELIDHGATGYLVNGPDEAVDAVEGVSDLDRRAIRAVAVRRFDVAVMVDKYIAVYYEILDGERHR